jgi:hypothetical protein
MATWQCQESGSGLGCSIPRPRLGTACATNFQACDYGSCFIPGGNNEKCIDGVWKTSSLGYPCAE